MAHPQPEKYSYKVFKMTKMTKNGVFQSFFHNNDPKMTLDYEYLESIPKYEFGL